MYLDLREKLFCIRLYVINNKIFVNVMLKSELFIIDGRTHPHCRKIVAL